MNKFDEWNEIKKELDGSKQGYVKAGKIYWLSIGQNIGITDDDFNALKEKLRDFFK